MLSGKKSDVSEVKDDGISVEDKGESGELVPVSSSLITEKNIDEMFLDAPGDDSFVDELDEPTRAKISRRIRAITKHQNAISPIQCRAERCHYIGTCPFRESGKFPSGLQCLVEQNIIANKFNDFCISFNVDRREPSPADMSLISRLVEIELTEYRLRATVATKYPEVLIQETIGVNPTDGSPVTKLAASPIFAVRKKLSEEKALILKELVGTRKEVYREKAALKQNADADYSSYIASLNKQLRELVEVQKDKDSGD